MDAGTSWMQGFPGRRGFLDAIARRHGRTTWIHGVHAGILRPRIRIARRHDVDTLDCCMNQSPDGRLAASPPRMKHRPGLPREPSCPRNSVVNSTSCRRLHARSVMPAHDGGHARARSPSFPRKRESEGFHEIEVDSRFRGNDCLSPRSLPPTRPGNDGLWIPAAPRVEFVPAISANAPGTGGLSGFSAFSAAWASGLDDSMGVFGLGGNRRIR